MEKHFEQAIRDNIATLSQEQKDYQIYYECLGKKPRIELLKLYVELGLSFSYISKTQDGILHVLAKKKKPDIMKMFIDLGADINAKNSKDETPLDICTNKGDIKSMKLLIEAGSDVSTNTSKGCTQLNRAPAFVKRGEANDLLLNNDDDIIANEVDMKRLGGHCIVFANHPRLITKELIDSGYFAHPDAHGVFPIHMAILHGFRECVEEFVKHGHDLNIQTIRSRDTPLHYAVRFGKDDLVRYLYEQDVDITLVNDKDETAIQLAERMQLPQVITALKIAQKEADLRMIQKKIVNIHGENSVSEHNTNKSKQFKKEKVKNILSQEETERKDKMHLSRIIKMMKESKVLLSDLRAEMREIKNQEIVDEDGKTIMHHAAINGMSGFVVNLIRRKICTVVKDNIDRTPLMYAILSGDVPTVKVLMDHGYDIHETDAMNNSLFVLAYWMEMYELAMQLIKEGADDRKLLEGRVE